MDFAECRFEAIFYTDADAQFDLHDIADLYPQLAEFDMVTGYRIGRQDRWIRFVTSGVYNRLQGWMLGLRVRDVNCAFKLFRRSFFDKVQLSSDGFLIDAELYARAKNGWSDVDPGGCRASSPRAGEHHGQGVDRHRDSA